MQLSGKRGDQRRGVAVIMLPLGDSGNTWRLLNATTTSMTGRFASWLALPDGPRLFNHG